MNILVGWLSWRSLFYGTEQFRHVILRNGTGSDAHTTVKNVACALKCASYRPDAVWTVSKNNLKCWTDKLYGHFSLANCQAFVIASYPSPNGPGCEASFSKCRLVTVAACHCWELWVIACRVYACICRKNKRQKLAYMLRLLSTYCYRIVSTYVYTPASIYKPYRKSKYYSRQLYSNVFGSRMCIPTCSVPFRSVK